MRYFLENNRTFGSPWSGHVGIGTTSPSAKLNIVGDSSATSAQLRISPTAGGSSSTSIPSYLDFWSSFDNYVADQGPRRTATIKAMYSGGNWGYEALSFHVGTGGQNDAANLPTERMRITGAGNVGMGINAPTAKLHVSGQIANTLPTMMAPTGTTQTVDWSLGNVQEISLASATGDVVVAMSNAVPGAIYMLHVIQGSTARNLSWGANVKWPRAIAPVISSTASSEDVLTFFYNGTSYYGTYGQDYR